MPAQLPTESDLTINAYPVKEFFIYMITKDITLSGCILDLIDNSIHSLIRETSLDVMERLLGASRKQVKAAITISLSDKSFRIEDDCGGISINDAETDVFAFGTPNKDRSHTGLSVYGIGMKRALFKLGKDIVVDSHTQTEEFRVKIDIDEWKNRKSWNHGFAHKATRKHATGGSTIQVRDLYPQNIAQFGTLPFQNQLRDRIGKAYALFIEAGVVIKVNTKVAEQQLPQMSSSKELGVVRQVLKKDGVDILIMAGASPRTDKVPRGWYVFCNGRMIIDSDKTDRTGWGEGLPEHHSKYNHFVGYVYFRCKDERKLPWTTTKDDIDRESPVWRFALKEMCVFARPVLKFFSDMYPGDLSPEGEEQRAILERARPITMEKIARQQNTAFRLSPAKPRETDSVSIQYSRPRSKVDKIRRVIGKSSMAAYKVGEYTFDYFFKRECD